jgi:hypothetical protein
VRLHLDEEYAGIELELRMAAARARFDLRSKWAVTVDELMRHLALRPTIIHFSCHGRGGEARGRCEPRLPHRDIESADGAGIYLQDENGRPRYVSAHAITQMIASAAPSVRVVVLNACFSDDLARSLCRIVDCVVGMRGAVDDHTARSFAASFYRALGNRSSVANAVAQAVATLGAKQLPGGSLPICRTREGIDAGRVILTRLDPR